MYVPLHVHSHYSLLDGLSKPEDIARRCVQIGTKACALTDHGSVSGAVQFVKAIHEVCGLCGEQKSQHNEGLCNDGQKFEKANIKPIIGCEFYICRNPIDGQDMIDDPLGGQRREAYHSHMVVLAKNYDGWHNLISAVSYSNRPEIFYRKPRIHIEELANHVSNLIGISGHPGSAVFNALWGDLKGAMQCRNGNIQQFLHPNYLKRASYVAYKYQEIFGKDNFFIECQVIDEDNSPATKIGGQILREIAAKTGIPIVATPDSHYPTKEDRQDQLILLCDTLKLTYKEINARLQAGQHVPLDGFFRSDNFHIPDFDEMKAKHKEDELDNTNVIADMCDDYNLESKPRLPKFPTPEGVESLQYLRMLCREGWQDRFDKIKRVWDTTHHTKEEYSERVRNELEVLEKAGLADYFLIVHDFTKATAKAGHYIGPGRGSAAGSLILYLLGITQVDPIEYDLLFERFYNEGRNTADYISLPDVDMDFEVSRRKFSIDYCRDKYGHDHVAHMATYTRLQGKSAIKAVFRAYGSLSATETNRLTKHMPDEHEIADQLKNMDTPSIIMWSFENLPYLQDYCTVDETGQLKGELAPKFAQAIRLEGTKIHTGRHAAGILISTQPLPQICPMMYDPKEKELFAGMDMYDLELTGHVKFDFLGNSGLDKLHMIANHLTTGEFGYDDI